MRIVKGYIAKGSMISPDIQRAIRVAQKNEITEYFIYRKLAAWTRDARNREILESIADDERSHYEFWKKHTGKDISPNRFTIWRYSLIAKILGLTFGIRLMEHGEKRAKISYDRIIPSLPEAQTLKEDEDKHENELIKLIDEERLTYIGSVVLGLNDALVELTGALAGLTLAFQNARVIAAAGFITGIAASLSMAVSEYLSSTSEDEGDGAKNPFRSALYTGVAYIVTVFVLIAPYLLLPSSYAALAATLFIAFVIILFFSFYVAVAKGVSFKKRFLQMALLSFGVAAFSFGLGYVVREVFEIKL